MIIAIVVVVIGMIVVSFVFVASLFSSGIPPAFQNGTTTVTNPFQQIPSLRTFLYEVSGVVVIAVAIWLAAWIKMCYSIKSLSKELSQTRLNTTGNLYLIQALFSPVGASLIFALLLSGNFSFSTSTGLNPYLSFSYGPFSGFLLGGYFIPFAIVGLITSIIMVIASYLGYSSLTKSLSGQTFWPQPQSFPTTTPPLTPPETTPSRQTARRYCTYCGQKLDDPNVTACPKCFRNLPSS